MGQLKIAIGVPCRVQGRWSPFWECLNKLQLPAGMAWNREVEVRTNYDNSVAKSRNNIARDAIKDGAEAIFWLDDDMLFRPHVLTQILTRPESIVIGLTMTRMRYTSAEEGAQFRPIWSDTEVRIRPEGVIWTPVQEIRTGPNGLMPLTSGTGGGVLTRIDVFDRIPAPWWRQGQLVPDMFWEDIYFYNEARRAGIQVWGDPFVRFGHMSDITLWPHQDPETGEWSTILADGFEGFLAQPWAVPEVVGA